MMMDIMDHYCDHAMMLGVSDPFVEDFTHASLGEVKSMIEKAGFFFDPNGVYGKLYVINSVPTAENLARHWYKRLKAEVERVYNGQVLLHHIRVYETPNCWSDYPAHNPVVSETL